ncbi:Uncharacterised protein [Bordetella pertussis]|nr:Uncharacterised protein [Bordetella pertussis]
MAVKPSGAISRSSIRLSELDTSLMRKPALSSRVQMLSAR